MDIPLFDRYLTLDDTLAQELAGALVERCISFRVDFLSPHDGWKFAFNRDDTRAVGEALASCDS